MLNTGAHLKPNAYNSHSITLMFNTHFKQSPIYAATSKAVSYLQAYQLKGMHLPFSSSLLQAVSRSFHSPLSSPPQHYRQKKQLSHYARSSFHSQDKIWPVFIITFYSNTNQCSCLWLQTCTETHIQGVSRL
jgi:hypothetical protein